MNEKEIARLKALNIRVYSTAWCPPCKTLKAYLDQRGIPYTSYDVEKDPSKMVELMAHTKGAPGVPVIVVGKLVYRGWQGDKAMNAILGIL